MVNLAKFSDEILAKYNIAREELDAIHEAYLRFAKMNSAVNNKLKKRVYKKKHCDVCNVDCLNIYMHANTKNHIKKLKKQSKKDTDSDTETVLSEDDAI